MARAEDKEPHVQETIDDSFPESEQPATKPRSQAPSNSKPQKNRPHTEEEEEDDLYYVSSQVHHQDQMPAQFPPQNSEYHELPNQHIRPTVSPQYHHQDQMPAQFPPQNSEYHELPNQHIRPTVSPQYHHQDQMPAQFPPQNSEYHELPNQHAPPPVSSQYHHQDQMPAQFPPQNSEYHALPNQHVPPPANMHFAHQVPRLQMGQPVMALPAQPFNVVAPQQDKAWNSDLFDCMKDPQNALITAIFPCITFGQIAEILDYGNTTCATSGMLYGCIALCIAIPCIMSCTYRTKLRARFRLMESPAQDWVVHCFCEWCALCQEYRELQHMGYDPTIGWMGNQARMGQQQNQQFGMTPPPGQRMMM